MCKHGKILNTDEKWWLASNATGISMITFLSHLQPSLESISEMQALTEWNPLPPIIG
jgi:hypothetical protein